ncbi:MAG TPA: GNAT family N-acetyltransferase [Terriglobales bacterium]|nr:GNAT family N-acetyltransferase [Terriglobales bacterium]
MEYRLATISDVPAMAKMRAAEWETEEYWQRRLAAYLQGDAKPQKAFAGRVTYAAVHEDRVAGFISGHLTRRFACDGELQFLNVIPEFRGMGVAAELLRRLAQWFVENNAAKICVDPDQAARHFYRKHGAVSLNAHWLVWNDIRTVLEPGAAKPVAT